jgi:hypothetical protein
MPRETDRDRRGGCLQYFKLGGIAHIGRRLEAASGIFKFIIWVDARGESHSFGRIRGEFRAVILKSMFEARIPGRICFAKAHVNAKSPLFRIFFVTGRGCRAWIGYG